MESKDSSMPSLEHLKSFFDRVDKNKSGLISSDELQQALTNGSWAPFNDETVQMMIEMFDTNHSGNINFDEFGALWKFINKWEQSFRLFDHNNSGSIDVNELKSALKHFGYFLNDEVVNLIMKKFNRLGDKIHFDDFIQCCIKITNLTRAYKAYDQDSDGWVNIHYNQFLGILFQ